MNAPIRVSDWYLRPPKQLSRAHAPAALWVCVAGAVFGHPKRAEGERTTTTRVVRVDGRKFWTSSGSAYVIEGEPLPQYVTWLKSLGREYDPEQPLAVLGRQS